MPVIEERVVLPEKSIAQRRAGTREEMVVRMRPGPSERGSKSIVVEMFTGRERSIRDAPLAVRECGRRNTRVKRR